MNSTPAINATSITAAILTTVKAASGDKPYPPLIKKVGFGVLPAIIVLSVFGNSLVIHLTRKYEVLKGPMKLLVINLSVCNIVLCFFPFMYVVELVLGDWHFGKKACNGLVVFEYAVLTSAKMSLIIIAIERYVAVVKPFKKKFSLRGTRWMVLIAWLVGWPFAVPFVILQNRYIDDHHPKAAAQPECNNMWAVTTVGMSTTAISYYSVMFVLLYVVPIIIMSVCYFRVIHVVLNKMQRPGHQTDDSKKRESEQKWRTIKMLIATMVVFQVCWLPSYIQEFLLAGGVQNVAENLKIQVINLICGAFGYVYCSTTPLLYFVFNHQYRRALQMYKRDMMGCFGGERKSKQHSMVDTRGTVSSRF